ncbi:poly-beta-1,6-N-acetyl-D-glucosamine N-deacetylase PgaB [Gluconacetobacter tumulicola]|uniref:Chitooligosaccharide deacetylase n=1 Tax=Gluconacetobacter tumulicola TaxID=1017177 RepID=A0A7W4JGF0_9PROT|nr:poly-beta-1,6-N-acetyl-D-glucosamine N-deacetylase PgaB [Gluconacetobacter tumulicola]MBB2180587.1 poly-beta-1,6-N-acetyl-D-glucosamine N-deacetylase PgaB [Gluconacetobacter tumulicola]
MGSCLVSRAVLFLAVLAFGAGPARAAPDFLAPAGRPGPITDKPWSKGKYLVLAYHDIEDGGADQRFLAVRTSALVEQFAWLKDNGYNIVGIDDLVAVQQGRKELPEKAVVLTFDDGYAGFYKRVFPLLKAYHWPALLAPVGEWMDTPAGKKVDFGGLLSPREQFLNWQEIREMSQSGLVEIGAHTYAEHKGMVANPQGNTEPFNVNRTYDARTGRYETAGAFEARVDKDVGLITQRIIQATGKKPRVWVWPYGAASGVTLAVARRHGYQMAMTLDDGLADINRNDNIPRLLVAGNPSLREFAQSVSGVQEKPFVRMVQVDLDYVYDSDPKQMSRNVDLLIQRVADLHANYVFLQAFADPAGDGNIKSVYFPNRWLPVRADLFNRVAWQLQTRGGARVYAWMPVLAFDAPDLPHVLAWNPHTGQGEINPLQYRRLSFFNEDVRKRIIGLYEDLAGQAVFSGILFHDDALLSDFEDASPDALKAYESQGLPPSIGEIRGNPAYMRLWTRFKSQALTGFTMTLLQHVRAIRGPQVESARNIYAEPVLQPDSEEWYAQNLKDFLGTYDWTVPMAMPLMEEVPAGKDLSWLTGLVETIRSNKDGLAHAIIELQTEDWRRHPAKPVADGTLVEWMKRLQGLGAGNYGYYPDDFIEGRPSLEAVRPVFSNRWYPLR